MPETGLRCKVAFVFNRQRNNSLEEAEFDTPEVIDAITNALRNRYEVVQIEMTQNGSWLRKLEDCRPDVILNTAEGFRGIGRESLAPICFEQLGLPILPRQQPPVKPRIVPASPQQIHDLPDRFFIVVRV